jgi:SAM-dependent methyltransferase
MSLPPYFEEPVCTICRIRDVEAFATGDYHLNLLEPLHTVRCKRCSLIFMSPRPAEILRTDLMNGVIPPALEVYGENHANYAGVTESRRPLFMKRLEELEKSLENRSSAAISFLDVGASSGVMVDCARERGWNAYGAEPSFVGASAALKNGIEIPQSYAEALPFPSNSFDIVHANHVVEHLVDPFIALSEFRRILKPGGVCFIEVPNQMENFMMLRDAFLKRTPQRKRSIRSIHHLWFFSRHSLPLLAQKAGFKSYKVSTYFGGTYSQGLRFFIDLSNRFFGSFLGGGSNLRIYAWK